MKPSPPERTAEGGRTATAAAAAAAADGEDETALAQQASSCFPFAWIAQKKPSPPHAADIAPAAPYASARSTAAITARSTPASFIAPASGDGGGGVRRNGRERGEEW